MKLTQSKILHESANPQSNRIRIIHAIASVSGGGGNALLYVAHYQTYKFQPHESISQKSIILWRFLPYAIIKALKMLGQSTLNPNLRILDCLDFLQKSRNDGVGGIIIARFGNAESWQSTPYRHSERSEESILAIRESHSIRLHCTNLNIIHLIRSWLIYFTHCLKLRVLDASLRINATLSMTKFLSYRDKTKRVVILRALARSIHFSDSRIALVSLTLSESMCLKFIRFAQFTRFTTPYTTFKGIKMQT